MALARLVPRSFIRKFNGSILSYPSRLSSFSYTAAVGRREQPPCSLLGLQMQPKRALASKSTVQVTVSSTEALIDEIVKIRSAGHEPGEEVTIRVETSFGNKPTYFHSHGHYRANPEGNVDSFCVPSVSGTYEGVDPMGLFWSSELIKGQESERMFQKDCGAPFISNVEVYKGFKNFDFPISSIHEELKSYDMLCQTSLKRRYLSDKVSRVEVRDGRLRGTLFIPQEGPHETAGIIDMFGTSGGLAEFRAALLASHGFVTYALPYFYHDDLPKKSSNIEAEYFEEAVDFLNSHPRVKSDWLGMLGSSRGGEMSLLTATNKPEVKAVVGVSTPHSHVITSIKIKGKDSGCSPLELDKCTFTPNNSVSTVGGFNIYPDKEALLPIEKLNADVLLLNGGDDQNLGTVTMGHQMKARLDAVGKGHLMELVSYPGAGHIIEPPFMPLVRESFLKAGSIYLFWGGEKVGHAFAQQDSWKRTIAFFKEKLLT